MQNFKIYYYDLLEDMKGKAVHTIQKDMLDNLFIKVLETNKLGFSDCYQTEFLIRELIKTSKNLVKLINLEYKISLISSSHYDIATIRDEKNNLISKEEIQGYYKHHNEIKIGEILKYITKQENNLNNEMYLILIALSKWVDVYNTLTDDTKKVFEELVA